MHLDEGNQTAVCSALWPAFQYLNIGLHHLCHYNSSVTHLGTKMQKGTRGSGQAEVEDQLLRCSTAPVVQVNQHRELRVLASLNVMYTKLTQRASVTTRLSLDRTLKVDV